MSKLLGERELSMPFTATTQLPISWYFDSQFHAAEQASLFNDAPRYVGHQLMVPNVNDYRVTEASAGAWALVINGASVELISNICRHRQAVMLKGQGTLASGNIVCPLHRWTYDNNGTLLGAPHFDKQPCLHLDKKTLSNWNGLLFEGAHPVINDLAKIKFANELDFQATYLIG